MNLKFILGMKLRNFRHEKGLSLKSLAQSTGLSASYINEIEKGKKYPKADKIMLLAEGLGVGYDELVSISLSERLDRMLQLFSSSPIHDFPYQLFGISLEDVMELFKASPQQATALATTLMEIFQAYDMNVEHFFLAALRAFQEIHDNYFEELERAAESFSRKRSWTREIPPSYEQLKRVLEQEFEVEVRHTGFADFPELRGQRYVYLPGVPGKLLLNESLSMNQHCYLLALQLGYKVLGIEERANTSKRLKVDSFEEVMENFRASYFAGALMINRFVAEDELKQIFRKTVWDGAEFLKLLEKHDVTAETYLHRLSQVLPGRFSISELHFMRFDHETRHDALKLTKELNMPRNLAPSGVRLNEHHCRRWLPITLLQEMRVDQEIEQETGLRIGIQRASFLDSVREVLFITIGRPLLLNPTTLRSVTLGLRIDEKLKRTVRFLGDPDIPRVEVHQTCERCPLPETECAQRAVVPSVYELEHRNRLRREAYQRLISASRGK